MKKIILLITLFMLLIPNIKASVDSASEYILTDLTTGRILEGKDYNNPKLIASTTKIMTCLLAIESNRLDEVVVVDDTVLKAYGSAIYIKPGEEITLKDLLYGLMLRSGNDAAIMVSTFVAGSEENFVNLMNNKAKTIGMTNTTFSNSSGLDEDDDGNHSTAYDMALLTRYAMQYDEFRKIVGTKKHSVKTNYQTYNWENKNKLLSNDYITGGKTGFTTKAGRTLVSSAKIDDMEFIVVTLRDSDDWNTHTSLYNKAKEKYSLYQVLNKRTFKVEDDYYKNKLYIKKDLNIPLTEEEKTKITTKIKLEKLKKYSDNEKVGVCEVYLEDKLITTVSIFIKKEEIIAQNSNFFSRIWEMIKFW